MKDLKVVGVTEAQQVVLDFLWLAEDENDLQVIEDTFGRRITEECKVMIIAAELIRRAQCGGEEFE